MSSRLEKALVKLNADRIARNREAHSSVEPEPTNEAPPLKPKLDNSRKIHQAPRRVKPPGIKIDFEKLMSMGLMPTDDQADRIATQYRLIKRPILKTAFGQGELGSVDSNLLMITSALAGEGKSFTSLNLALSIAQEQDRTVLLIDGDVARHRITTLLGLEGQAGLTDLLTSDSRVDLAEAMVSTDVKGLNVLPSGEYHDELTELLASQRMNELVAEIAGRYSDRMIIIDSPPILATSEAAVLSALVGQIVVVVEADGTSESAVQNALSELPTDKQVSLVLNKSRGSAGSGYFGGYYQNYGPAKR